MDKLSLLKGNALRLTDELSIRNITLGEIIDIGYDKYIDYLSTMISSSLDVADILWYEMQIWYEDIKDEWTFFLQKSINEKELIDVYFYENNNIVYIEKDCMCISKMYEDALNFFFQLNGKYIVLEKKNGESSQLILCNVKLNEKNKYTLESSSFKFTKYLYELLIPFLKEINWINDYYDFTHGGNKRAKKTILLHHYNSRHSKHRKMSYITLDSIVSSLISSGHNFKDIWDYPIYLIYDQYYRTIKINEYNNTINALYNGCIDTKKNPINWEKINWSAVIER